MISLKTFLAIIAVLPAGIHARDCTTSDNNNTPLKVSNLEDLSVFNGCTSITGDIAIDHSYSGSFILNGITTFNGSISMDENLWANDLNAIEMLDLLEITNIHLPQTWGLKSLNLMRLQHIKELSFIQGPQGGLFDLGALETAKTVSIAGMWINISLPALETVTSLTIATDPLWKITERVEPLEIHLPSLREAGWISIRGHVSRLETPKLEKVGTPSAPEPNGMEVLANYTDLQGVYLVSLKELYGGLLLDGYISGVNLNGMSKTDATIKIRAGSRMSIYSSLQDAGVIDLSGEFEAINFEEISTATSLTISPTITAQCPASLVDVYNKINYPREATFCSNSSGATSSGSTSNFSEDLNDLLTNEGDDEEASMGSIFPSYEDVFGDDDNEPSSSRSHEFPTAVIVLLPLIIGVTCCTAVWCWARRRGAAKRAQQQRRQGNAGGAGGDVEAPIQQVQPAVVRDRYGHGVDEFNNDPPPAYSVDTPTRERSRYF
ncbi:hypothetical protein BJX63DRAFT_259675 [Aspergillus granulosus]|uniref:Receptor L-domain domain-containing protein n=1 Tax=Aspergillus granulosus TaxID=176169 RepID=A0ABR4I2K4_9EURO